MSDTNTNNDDTNQGNQGDPVGQDKGVDNPGGANSGGDGSELLGPAGLKALQSERERAAAAESELKAMREKIAAAEKAKEDAESSTAEQLKSIQGELDSIKAAKEKAERDALVASVAVSKGLPESLAARLQGDDREALEADADALMEHVKAQPRRMSPDPTQGNRGAAPASPKDAFASAFQAAFG